MVRLWPAGFALLFALFCAACTSVDIQPVPASQGPITKVCIERNPKVIVPEFTDVLEEGFARHDIITKIYDEVPADCAYRLTYVAFQGWDLTNFLTQVHLALYKGDKLIAYADRHSPKGLWDGGGWDFSKWDSTRTKMNPIIDQLLNQVAPVQK